MRKVYYRDLTLHIPEDVYNPAEDTFLLAENLKVRLGDFVLDMGTGCGIIAILAARKARMVLAVDVNPHAATCTWINGKLNGVSDRLSVVCGDLFRPVRENLKFDLITFNPPYLPSDDLENAGPAEHGWLSLAWSGGRTGRELIDRFIEEAPQHLKGGGRILLIQSDITDVRETIQRLRARSLKAGVIAEEKVPFERIYLIEAEKVKV